MERRRRGGRGDEGRRTKKGAEGGRTKGGGGRTERGNLFDGAASIGRYEHVHLAISSNSIIV